MSDAPASDRRDTFATLPRLELDELLRQLIDRAEDVLATENRLGALLGASRMIIGDLDLHTVLRRIVEAACQLVDATYGALGVIAPQGGELWSSSSTSVWTSGPPTGSGTCRPARACSAR